MKNRTSLVLMELLVMVLVFALAAAMCVRVFVRSDQVSREIGRRDMAVTLAQNGAETIKICRGDMQQAAQLLEGEHTRDACVAYPLEGYRLEISRLGSDISGLGRALVTVWWDGEELFSLPAAWQEVLP